MAQHEEISFDEELRKAVDEEPFRPFLLWLTSGDHFRVADIKCLVVGSSVISYVHPRQGVTVFRKNQLVAIEIPIPSHHE